MEGNQMNNNLHNLLARLTLRASRGELNPRERAALDRAIERYRGERPATRHNRPFFFYR